MNLPSRLCTLLENLPEVPGVYRLKNHAGRILYIGKSKNLRDRVRTYFRDSPPDRKVAHLRARTKQIDFLVLESDRQAQEVEWDLIRHHGPPYNTLFLDYWNHPYIKLTVGEPYPRIELTQTQDDPDAEYYGPYKNTRRLRDTLIALRETFPLRDCELAIPPGGDRDQFETCMEYELDRCTAPCVGRESVESYRDRLEPVRSFLNGNYSTVLELLQSRMEQEARDHQYEAAALYRDRLQAVKNMVNYEPFLRETLRCDVWARSGDRLVFLKVRGHRVIDFRVQKPKDTPESVVESYYGPRRPREETLILDDSLEGLEDSLEAARGAETEEEERLRTAARRTARHHDELGIAGRGKGLSSIVDRVTFWNRTAVIERTGDEYSGDRRKKSLRRPERGLRDTVLPLYRNDLESGRVLPSELRVRTRDGIRLDAENLWSDCSFWFPIFREDS